MLVRPHNLENKPFQISNLQYMLVTECAHVDDITGSGVASRAMD